MAWPWTRSAVAVVVLSALCAPALGGESKRPPLSTDEAATAAVATFQEEFKAKGLTGQDRTSQRDFAMSKVVKVQHAKVVAALAQVAKGNPDATVRTLAVLYLGDQKALPGTAGKEVLATLERNRKDLVLILSALDSFGNLRYVGASETIREMLQDQDFTRKKAGIVASGRTRDVRLLPDLLKMLKIEVKPGGEAEGDTVVQEGYSWEGAEAHVDTGTPGPGDQQAAEAAVAAAMAANQAAAAGGGGGGGGGGATGTGRGSGGGGRNPAELTPHILTAIKHITGERFTTGKQIVEWLNTHKGWIADERKAVEEEQKRQHAEGKDPKAS